MISEKTRNTLVGTTLLLALVLLMYGILILGKTPSWGALRPYLVTLNTPNANGVTVGSKVDLNGVLVGQVKSVNLKQDAAGLLRVQVILLFRVEGRHRRDGYRRNSERIGRRRFQDHHVGQAGHMQCDPAQLAAHI